MKSALRAWFGVLVCSGAMYIPAHAAPMSGAAVVTPSHTRSVNGAPLRTLLSRQMRPGGRTTSAPLGRGQSATVPKSATVSAATSRARFPPAAAGAPATGVHLINRAVGAGRRPQTLAHLGGAAGTVRPAAVGGAPQRAHGRP